jgi:hypothetical protein
MSARLLSDFATPYDIMVGFWAKQSVTYDPKGKFIDAVPGLVAVYWKQPGKIIHFREDLEDVDEKSAKQYAYKAAVTKLTRTEFDLRVRGKTATGGSHGVTVSGTETRPDVYHFHLNFKSGDDAGDWYNSHHYVTDNERHIMGPFVPAGMNRKIQWIVVQTLTRISFDIPEKLVRKLQR